MSLGAQPTKQQLDLALGNLTAGVGDFARKVDRIKSWVDTQADIDLEALGYTVQEITLIRTALIDLAQLAGIYRGNLALPTAKDFRQFTTVIAGPLPPIE